MPCRDGSRTLRGEHERESRSARQLRKLAEAARAMRAARSESDALALLEDAMRHTLDAGSVAVLVPAPPGREPRPGALEVELVDREGVALGLAEAVPSEGTAFDECDEAALAVLAQLATAAVEKWRSATQLEAEHHLLEAMFESLPVGVAVAQATQGGAVLCNDAMERILGGRVEAVAVGDPAGAAAGAPSPARAFHADGRPFAPGEYPLARALAGETVAGEQTRFVREDGSEVLLRVAAAPIRGSSGDGGAAPVEGAIVTVADVTDQVRAVEAMRESDRRLERALELTSTTVWEWDVETGELLSLGSLDRIPRSVASGVADFPAWAERHVHPDDRTDLCQALDAAVRDRGGYLAHYRVLQADGGERWLESRGTAVERERGRVVLLGVTRDIDRQKRADLAAAEIAELNRLVLDNSMDILALLDRDGHYVLVSRSHEALLGWGREELLGRAPREFVHPDDLERALAEYATARDREGRSHLGPHRFRRRDGSWAVLESSVMPIRNEAGSTRLLLVTARDLSSTTRHAAALEASEARFRTLFEQAPIGISLLDPEGRWLAANDAFRTLVGYSLDELGELTLAGLAEGDDRDAAAALIAGALAEPTGRHEAEAQLVCRDGSRVWVWLSAAVVSGGDGEPGFVIAMAQDRTARKQLEDQLRQAQKLESIGRLAGGIAHDFNNLLTVVTGYVGVLERSLEGTPQLGPIRQIGSAAARGAALTRQLLAFSRQQMLAPRLVDLNEIVAGTSSMLELLVGKDVRIVRHLAEQRLSVHVDPGQVEQVIVNLVVNARDAMRDGGTVVIETGTAELDAGYAIAHGEAHAGPYALLAVSDTGTGMDADTLSQVFEPFFTTKGAAGTGLGLSTVHGIVHQSGGVVHAYSEPGRGSTFKVYLPLLLAGTPESLDPAEREAAPGGSETVLLVEDEPELRALVSTLLEERGYRVLGAASAEEAILRLESAPPGEEVALLLTDLVLTGMNGRRLAEFARVLQPGIRTLFMSGYSGDAVTQHDDLDPGAHFLQKPFTAADLARSVRRAIEG